MPLTLNAAQGLIFRITHRDNVPWMIENGVQCRNSAEKDPSFINIGNAELIHKRQNRQVPIEPSGTLSDYVSFYFTPYSPMFYNINTGYNGITKRRNEEIVIIISTLRRLEEHGVAFVFTDRHAYLQTARYYSDLDDLNKIDWELLQARDFRRDPDDPGKVERYQAEALVHQELPVAAISGVACCDKNTEEDLRQCVDGLNVDLTITCKPGLYF